MNELFNRVDIESNRQGKISEQQAAAIKALVSPMTWVWGTLICVVLAVPVYWLTDGFSGDLGIIGWVIGAVLLFCLLRLAWMAYLRYRLLSESVQVVEGSIVYTQIQGQEHPGYQIETAQGERLNIQGLSGLQAMLPPGDYRFYYLPTRRWLLSSEPLSKEAELKANLLEVLSSVFEFERAGLPALRARAAAGQIQTVEGRPKVTTSTISHQSYSTDSDDSSHTETTYHYRFAFEIQGMRFDLAPAAAAVLIDQLPYRVYYDTQQPEESRLLAIEPL